MLNFICKQIIHLNIPQVWIRGLTEYMYIPTFLPHLSKSTVKLYKKIKV